LLHGVGDDTAYVVSRIAEQISGRTIIEEYDRCRPGTGLSVAEDYRPRG
jgi:hypothetical protein